MHTPLTIFNFTQIRRGGLFALLFFLMSGISTVMGYAAESPLSANGKVSVATGKTTPAKANTSSKKSKKVLQSSSEKAVDASSGSTFENPDFAFPADVRRDAYPQFEAGLKEKDAVKAIKAAMELTAADRIVTPDSISPAVARYDRLAELFGAPWNSVSLLLKAQLLNSVYSMQTRKFDNRVLPEDEIPAEPLLWSGEIMRKTINESLQSALSKPEILSGLPLSLITPLLQNYKDAEDEGWSVLDFATHKALNIIQNDSQDEIPFRKIDAGEQMDTINDSIKANQQNGISKADLISNLIDFDAKRGKEGKLALLSARLLKANLWRQTEIPLDDELISGYAKELLDCYTEGSGLRPLLIARLYNAGFFSISDLNRKIELYNLVKNSLDNFGILSCSDSLQSQIKEYLNCVLQTLTNPYYSIQTTGQWLSSTPNTIILTAHNVKDANLILVPVAPSQVEGSAGDKFTLQNLHPAGIIRELRHFEMPADIPSELIDTITIDASSMRLSPGYYVPVLSSTKGLDGIFPTMKRNRPDVVLLSNLNIFTADDCGRNPEHTSRLLYVTNAADNSPIAGAKVDFTSEVYKERGKKSSAVTDKEGKVNIPFATCSAVITHDKERVLWRGNRGYLPKLTDEDVKANIFTDLALYHPGDTIQAAVVVARYIANNPEVAADRDIRLVLRNANYQPVDTISLKTDKMGRAAGKLHIPVDGLTGRFTLVAYENNNALGGTDVEIAEYKAPSFRVNLDNPEASEDKIVISGNVSTYSGMPLSNCRALIEINFIPWWHRWSGVIQLNTKYGTSVTTDEKGCFSLTLTLPQESRKDYRTGVFSAIARVTSPAGETRDSESCRFSIGEGYTLHINSQSDYEVTGDSISLPIRVVDLLGNQVKKKLRYSIVRLSKFGDKPDFNQSFKSGEFTSPQLILPSDEFPSGLYSIRINLDKAILLGEKDGVPDWRGDSLETDIILWRADDKKPPMETPLWVPVTSFHTSPGQNHVEVKVGASCPSEWIFMEMADKNGILKREWLRPDGKNIKIKTEVPKQNEAIRIYFAGSRNLENKTQTVVVYPPQESRMTEFVTETFRDRLVPGMTETWKFRLISGWPSHNNLSLDVNRAESLGGAAVIAVLYNHALDAITPFRWDLSLKSWINYSILGDINYKWINQVYSSADLRKYSGIDCSRLNFTDPEFQFSDIISYGRMGIRLRGGMYSSTAMMNTVNMKSERTEMAMDDGAVEQEVMMDYLEDAPVAAGAPEKLYYKKMSPTEIAEEEKATAVALNTYYANASNELEMRQMEMPLAFFRPFMATDSSGVTTIEFEVPNFNTTWTLQLLGYDKDLNSAILSESAIASKPVMVSTSMPRFLLTGDKAQIPVTVFNNSDETLSIDTQIEIFDVVTGKVIASKSADDMEIAPSSSEVTEISFLVPSDLYRIGVRSIARSSKGSDGEQDWLPVYPSSTPVAESSTFYFTPGCGEKVLQIPTLPANANVTFDFCDNPGWSVLTELSGNLEPASDSALVQAAAMFSNCVAGGLISDNDFLRQGLEKMVNSQRENLTSPLEKNAGLKLTSLNCTPWVNNAAAETQRMMNLSSLLDEQGLRKSLSDRIEGLSKTYNSDGSWSWMKGMPGSEWITLQVLSCLGQLRASGYLPADKRLKEMMAGGINYSDLQKGKEYTEWKKHGKDFYPLADEVAYMYMRDNVTDSRPSGAILEMQSEMLKRLPAEWKNLSLFNKATGAILLHRSGTPVNKRLAAKIMESVRQFATYSEDKGLWFDNLETGYFSPSPLLLISRCLDAYREIDPKNEAIAQFEQYLVLSRQTADWNLELGEAGVASVVNSLLGGNTRGNVISSARRVNMEVYLNDHPIELPSEEEMFGNISISLDPALASNGKLIIHRHGETPAWGGVISQYVAPIAEVKAADVPQLKIEKRLIPISVTEKGVKGGKDTGSFKKGERIRVTLTVTTDRELDYVLISDKLGAWMQPAEQLTRYEWQDGIGFLRETRQSDVNFYITRLPKGKFIINYEVNADRDGEYSTGIAAAQSQYYPLFTAHTAGRVIQVTGK